MLPQTPLYGITDSTLMPTSESLYLHVSAALSAGCKIIQYRDKSSNAVLRLEQAITLTRMCHQHDAVLIINDDVQLCVQANADGVHLGQDDMTLAEARAVLGTSAIIGITCHDQLDTALNAQQAGADYVAFGRFFESKTKPSASYAPLALLRDAKKTLTVPIVAIGGITLENTPSVLSEGADMVAVVHALFHGTPDEVSHRTRSFLHAL